MSEKTPKKTENKSIDKLSENKALARAILGY
jgi:hypothetical protein